MTYGSAPLTPPPAPPSAPPTSPEVLGTFSYMRYASTDCSGEPIDTSSFSISFKSDFTDSPNQCFADQGGTSAFQLCNGTTYRRRAFATA